MAAIKTVMIGEIKYHLPLIDLIPFDPEQDKQLGAAIEEDGEVLEAVVCWKEKSTKTERYVVDGAHRVRHAARLKLDSVPAKMRSYESEEDAKADCEQRNLNRRHLGDAEREMARRARVERVAEMRRQGESLRAIAEQEKISHEQARKDLKNAQLSTGLTTETPKSVTGTDGKTYKAEKVCKRCKRLGSPVKNCNACERLRKDSAAKAKKTRETKAAAKAAGVVDDFGNPIPPKRLTDWQDPWIQETYDFLTTHSEQLRDERLISRMEKRAKRYPWFDAEDFVSGVGFIIQYFDDLIQHIKLYRPAGVCPACDGAGCDKCRSSGFVPRETYQEMKK